MANRIEKRNLSTIPVGSLGMIPLEKKLTNILSSGEPTGIMSIKQILLFLGTSETPIF